MEIIKAQVKTLPRKDMYEKMMKLDPSALTAEEHALKGVTKWRYLRWRDTTTSTSSLGFRIEGIMVRVKSTIAKAHLKQFQAASMFLPYICVRGRRRMGMSSEISGTSRPWQRWLRHCSTSHRVSWESWSVFFISSVTIFITNSECLTY